MVSALLHPYHFCFPNHLPLFRSQLNASDQPICKYGGITRTLRYLSLLVSPSLLFKLIPMTASLPMKNYGWTLLRIGPTNQVWKFQLWLEQVFSTQVSPWFVSSCFFNHLNPNRPYDSGLASPALHHSFQITFPCSVINLSAFHTFPEEVELWGADQQWIEIVWDNDCIFYFLYITFPSLRKLSQNTSAYYFF